jgi:hypothetical protein
MLMTTNTHTFFPEAISVASVAPRPKLDTERQFGNVIALAERYAR